MWSVDLNGRDAGDRVLVQDGFQAACNLLHPAAEHRALIELHDAVGPLPEEAEPQARLAAALEDGMPAVSVDPAGGKGALLLERSAVFPACDLALENGILPVYLGRIRHVLPVASSADRKDAALGVDAFGRSFKHFDQIGAAVRRAFPVRADADRLAGKNHGHEDDLSVFPSSNPPAPIRQGIDGYGICIGCHFIRFPWTPISGKASLPQEISQA